MDERLKDGLIEFKVKSSYDGTEQPNLFLPSDSGEKRPLLVGLHTWSFDRFNQIENMLPFAEEQNFHLLLPEFRGLGIATSVLNLMLDFCRNIGMKKLYTTISKENIASRKAYEKRFALIEENNDILRFSLDL